MAERVKEKRFIQGELFESADQSYFLSEVFGLLDFHPAEDDKWIHNCQKCLLWDPEKGQTEECLMAPCTPSQRADHSNGYYSIKQMPRR